MHVLVMDSENGCLRIVMFPWLAHGHIFPFLELAKRILKTKSFHIYLTTTPINFSSINQFIQTNSLESSIELVQLHLDPNPLLPPHYHTTKNLPPHLIRTLIKAFQTAKSSFSNIITALKPHLVMFDAFQPWAAKLASSLGIPAVHFSIVGAATVSYGYQFYNTRDDSFPFPHLCLQDREKESFDGFMEFLLDNVFDQDRDLFFANVKLSSQIVLVKTSSALEGKYVNYLSSLFNKRILVAGPLVTDADKNKEENSDMLMQWLSQKEENSTVYVSFGSEYFLSKEEMVEIAKGLELSGVNFIWVVRFPAMEKTMSSEEALPEGFLERVKDRGRVVMGWVPQANILGHPGTGAFISHCGWSSLNESIYYGVPVIGMPVRINMFIDAKMVVDAGACVEVPRDENGRFKGEAIAKAIDEVKGGGLRRRAKELSEKMKMEEEEAINGVAEELSRIGVKK